METRNKKGKSDAIDMMVAARLKTLRLSHGASQQEMAKKLGVTFQMIQKYESGACRITSGKLCKAADILGVPVQAFFPDQYTDTKQLDIFQADTINSLAEIGDAILGVLKKIKRNAA